MKNKFRKWMDANNLTYLDIFAKTGIDPSTLAKWGSLDRQPRQLYLERLEEKYPDCPLVEK